MATSLSVALHFKRLFGCALSNVSGARASPTHVLRAPVSSVTAVVAAASLAVAAAAIVMVMVAGSAMAAVVTVATPGSARVEAGQAMVTVAV